VPLQAPLDPGSVCEALVAAGFRYRPSQLAIEAREERWLVRLPDQRLAWLAASARGLEGLRNERRVLRLIEERCSFAAPRVLYESADGALDVRTMVPGAADARRFYGEARASSELAMRFGAAIGAMLAEQHTRIGAADVTAWLPRRPSWPEPRGWILERLPRVVDDARLVARAQAVIDAYESVAVQESDRALVHTDVGFHNLAIDSESRAVRGVFDYEGATWADRHHDFRYLVFDLDRHDMLDAACSVYEPVVGRPIRRDRVFLYNAACAVTFLAYRAGHAAEERWCGRTLAEDLKWSTEAIAKAAPSLG
jgi:aminoglycoside phosphotransferase (APT) family kinase protein